MPATITTTHPRRPTTSWGPCLAALLLALAVPAAAADSPGDGRGHHGSPGDGGHGTHSGHGAHSGRDVHFRGGGHTDGGYYGRASGHRGGHRYGYPLAFGVGGPGFSFTFGYSGGDGHGSYGYPFFFGFPSYYAYPGYPATRGGYAGDHSVQAGYLKYTAPFAQYIRVPAAQPAADSGPELEGFPRRGTNGSLESGSSAGGDFLDARAAPARLDLTIEPGEAAVYLDGRFLGIAEELPASGLLIEPGAHRIEVVHPGYDSNEVGFVIASGGELTVVSRLEARTDR